jgi:hypothetical protein
MNIYKILTFLNVMCNYVFCNFLKVLTHQFLVLQTDTFVLIHLKINIWYMLLFNLECFIYR